MSRWPITVGHPGVALSVRHGVRRTPHPLESIMTITVDLRAEMITNGGFTYDPQADQLITVGSTVGYAIAVPGTEHHFGRKSMTREEFAALFAIVITEWAEEITVDGCVIGGWMSPDRGYMIELTKIWRHVDRATAIMLGVSSHQEAIFDLATGEEIPTGGRGDYDITAPITAADDDLDTIDDDLTG